MKVCRSLYLYRVLWNFCLNKHHSAILQTFILGLATITRSEQQVSSSQRVSSAFLHLTLLGARSGKPSVGVLLHVFLCPHPHPSGRGELWLRQLFSHIHLSVAPRHWRPFSLDRAALRRLEALELDNWLSATSPQIVHVQLDLPLSEHIHSQERLPLPSPPTSYLLR